MRLDQTILVNATAELEAEFRELLERKCAPWTDEGIPMLSFARAEDALTDEQHAALMTALAAMTPEAWDAFGVAMLYDYCATESTC
jgi:hypothetical protein